MSIELHFTITDGFVWKFRLHFSCAKLLHFILLHMNKSFPQKQYWLGCICFKIISHPCVTLRMKHSERKLHLSDHFCLAICLFFSMNASFSHLYPITLCVKQLVALPTFRNKVTGVEKFHFQYIIELWFIASYRHICICVNQAHSFSSMRVYVSARVSESRSVAFFKDNSWSGGI